MIDKSSFKGKDLGLLIKVMGYLVERLNVEFRGSVLENTRNYRNIDIVVKGDSNPEGRYNAIMGLARAMKSSTLSDVPFMTKVVDYSQKYQEYVNTTIDNRFTIQSKNPRTTINLCFEKIR